MSREKQIEEMARIICADSANKGLCEKCGFNKGCWKFKDAESIYNAGYRKQSEGEWIDTGDFELDNIYSGWKCSLCGHIFCGNKTNYCSKCGAKMSKGNTNE